MNLHHSKLHGILQQKYTIIHLNTDLLLDISTVAKFYDYKWYNEHSMPVFVYVNKYFRANLQEWNLICSIWVAFNFVIDTKLFPEDCTQFYILTNMDEHFPLHHHHY